MQFASKMGFETVAIARRPEQADAAADLGAHHYIASSEADIAAQLQALGGAAVVLATAGNSEAMSAAIGGLRRNGELIVLGGDPQPIEVSPFDLIPTSRTIHGHPSGTARDVEETLAFAALSGVRPVIETRPLDEVNDAYDRMLSGEARFRMVLTTGR